MPRSKVFFLGDYPQNKELSWSNECQGVTHDTSFWYISQFNTIWKFPVSYNLNKNISEYNRRVGIPVFLKKNNYDHFGDIDFYNGYLYLSLQNKDYYQPKIVVFRAKDLEFISEANLGTSLSEGSVSTCAINPSNGFLYTSKYQDSGLGLFVYHQKILNNKLILKYYKRLPLYEKDGYSPLKIYFIQGVKFSQSTGLLYVVSDNGADGGIFIFEPNTGKLIERIKLLYNHIENGEMKEEFQGLTIWDLDNNKAPFIKGQMHLILINNIGNNSADKVSFKHFKISYEGPDFTQKN